ncbi:condensation domain-containing protein [Nocardiopsis valliformis]|uniref:condensation domain-containing protein n=1 Tax=Nocardiopsis valliformis TaxID=239974 RepID=UPI00035EEC9B|nr:condensation domain-containing protein [Nocardiopsis valliformis]
MFDSRYYIPLAVIQEHFWTPDSSRGRSLAQTECAALKIGGHLDRPALEHAVLRLLGRHEILRVVMADGREGPAMHVPPAPVDAPLTWTDLTSEPDGTDAERARATLHDFANAGVDLGRGPLLRFLVMELADSCVLALAVHHLVADATAVRLILAELNQDYLASLRGEPSPVPEPELQYGDFVEWERTALLPVAEKSDGEFWERTLEGAPTALDLRPDRPRPSYKGDRGTRRRHVLAETDGGALLDLARAHNATPYTVSLAAFAALVSLSTEADDFLLGVLTSNRSTPQLERLVGQLSNTVALRLRTGGDPDAATLITRCGRVVTDALEHERLPLGRVIERVSPRREPGRTPLIQHLFLPKVDALGDLSFGGLPTEPVEAGRDRGRFDTIVEVEATPDSVTLWVEYDTAIHTAAGIDALVRDYDRLLAAWLAEPGLRLSQLPLGGPANRTAPRPDLATALGLATSDTVLLDTAFSEAEAVEDAVGAAGAHLSAAGQAEETATVAVVPAGEFSAYAENEGFRVVVVDGPVTAEEIGLLRQTPGRRAVRLFRLGNGALGAADITGLPHAWPVLLHVGGARADVAGSGAGASPFSPGTLLVDSEDSSLRARWSPEGSLEVVSGTPFLRSPEREAAAPEQEADDQLLRLMCELWAELLETPEVGGDDDFFVLGGHSMVAARVIIELQDVLGVEVGIRTLFENPTPALLTDRIRDDHPGLDEWLSFVESGADFGAGSGSGSAATAEGGPAPAGRPGVLDDEGKPIPLLASQRQLWLAEQANPGALTHTIPLMLRIDGPLDGDALRGAVADVLRHQPGLRAEFGQQDGEPFQRIVPLHDYDVPLIDLGELPDPERAERNRLLEDETAHGGFDISTAPLLRSRLVRLSESRHVLHLLFHHLVTDEVSMSVFMRELSEFYRARVEGRAPAPPELRLGFTEFTLAEQRMLTGPEGERLRRFWTRELVNAPSRLDVPTDRPRPEQPGFTGEFLEGHRSSGLLEVFAALARRHRTTRFTVFCAAVVAMLHRLTGQTELVLGIPTENRFLPGSELLIGCFLNVVPLRVDCSGDPSLSELVDRTGRALLRSYEHQALPFAEIVAAVAPERSPGVHPIYQIACELQLDSWLPLDLPGCQFSYEMLSHGTARYDMAFHALLRANDVSVMLELNTEVWDRRTGLNHIDEVVRILEQAAARPGARLSEAEI